MSTSSVSTSRVPPSHHRCCFVGEHLATVHVVFEVAGIIFCAACHARLYGKVGRGGHYYRCASRCPGSRYVRADAIERLVWEEVTRALGQPELVLAEAKRQRESKFSAKDGTALRLETVKVALAKLPAERKRVLDTHQEGYLPWSEAKARLDEIKKRQAELEAAAGRLEGSFATATADGERELTLRTTLQRFGRRLEILTPEERSVVLRGFVRRITVGYDGAVTLDAYLPVAPDGTGATNQGRGEMARSSARLEHFSTRAIWRIPARNPVRP